MISAAFLRPAHLLCAMVLSLSACTTAPASPAWEAQFEAVAASFAPEQTPGLIMLVDGPDRHFELAAGYADRETQAPMQMSFVMRAGSLCKTYMAALTVMIAEDGLLDLDAPISAYLDAEILRQLPVGLDPTVRQLMNHTSGVPDYYSERFHAEDWTPDMKLTPELVLHAIRGLDATGVPGEHVEYSNTNYHLLALVLEAATGKPVGEQLQSRLLDPLGLAHTYYDVTLPPGDEIHGYGTELGDWADTYLSRENSGPDGGMFMTAEDLTVWLRALFSADGQFHEIGETMQAGANAENARHSQGMGVEIMTTRDGVRLVGHTGGIDGYFTVGFYIPEKDTVLVLHINRSDEAVLSRLLKEALQVITG